MMILKYHGLLITNNHFGQLRFGLGELLSSCNILLWAFSKEELPESAKKFLKSFNNRAYMQCVAKTRDTIFKLTESIRKLSNFINIVEDKNKYDYDGAPIDTAAIYLNALNDIPYHLDSLFTYLRILADCLAFALPFFYETKVSIPNRSFRDHMKWFQKTNPTFDIEYTKILNTNSSWFEKLAGKDIKGIRDIIFHRFGTYQLGWSELPNGKHPIYISLVTDKGTVEPNLQFTLEEIIIDFFKYLDATYELFGTRVLSIFSPIKWDLTEKSLLMSMEMENVRLQYRFYPLIGETKEA